jgi:aryl-alcohol dehydrogenase-like predicted oxidoreductase
MKTRALGLTNIQITPLLMGTWQAGKRAWVGIEDEESIKAIRAAFEAGITTVDTAEVYGDGHSEQIIAKALSDVRDRVVYATKVFANHLKYDQVIEACDRSLKNLNTDCRAPSLYLSSTIYCLVNCSTSNPCDRRSETRRTSI